jgi:CubicO group peptidase (beta-lactamase class C family)
MNRRNACIALFLMTILLWSSLAYAQTKPLTDSIDLFIKAKMKSLNIPGLQLAVVRHGQLERLGNYGLANIQDSIAVNDHTLFPINSITKAFVGVAVTQLVAEGKLDLNAPISNYLDSLPKAWQQIAINRLLTHTSGLPEIWGDDAIKEGEENNAWKQVQAAPLLFTAGERFSYNQTNYLLIGKVIDKLSGQPFDQFIKKRQLDIAQLNTTFFGDAHTVRPNTARSYTFFKQVDGQTIRSNQISNVFEEVPPILRTAAGMHATAKELSQWLIALQRGTLLDQGMLKTLWTPGLLNKGTTAGFNQLLNGYALGWPTISRAEHPAYAPTGGGRSAIFVYPADDLAIIVLTNMQGCSPEAFMDEIAGFYLPDMKEANGFGLSPNLRALRKNLLNNGFDKAILLVKEEKKKAANYQINESEVNAWAYKLLRQGQANAALEIFKLNVYLYPNSANGYDSLGEMYKDLGNTKLAVKNYKQALLLDPTNTTAAAYLKEVAAQ